MSAPPPAEAPPETTPGLAPEAAPAGRLRLTAYAALQVLMFVPITVLFVLWFVAGTLALLWIGIPILVALVPMTRAVANLHRRLAARVLGVAVQQPYRPLPPDGGWIARLRAVLADPMTWRDLAWMLAAMTLGLIASLVMVVLLAVVATGLIWYFAGPPLMQARARMDLFFLNYSRTERLEQRVQVLTETRAEAVDASAAELRRLERDLHDGAQARLVALSMRLGMAEQALDQDPEAARRMVTEARATTGAAIDDLRSVVRGIHPPVLADRGLEGAIRAVALDMAVPVDVDATLGGRPPAPVESAVYFGVAECLANVGKHADAENAWVRLSHAGNVLRAVVGDDGRGGADPARGTGILGVRRRLAAFDGTLTVASPDGGPTIVTMEVPCDLSSPKTTHSSGPA
ncbi:MAG: sensor domain-containing protein [Nocardioides sp.]|uniref:sensor histidine kinase n=1 Tax=Nocardioides sp. TaxID=35761 RepID=UPI0039E41E91